MPIHPTSYYIDGVLNGDRRILAKAITLVESRLPAHREQALELIETVLSRSGNAIRLGISGVPGVGKSTFIENFGMRLIDRGHRLAVLAVDPSSPRSGGSILADKTRMERLTAAPSAFVRPSPSGGTLGGVARMTRETMLLCEAGGFDVIIVETVGVGQSEATVASMVDFFLLLMITGAGDALQGIKKGILELVHAVAINKADGDNMVPAERTRRELEKSLHLMQPVSDGWCTPVVTCSAKMESGLDEIWDLVVQYHHRLAETGELHVRRRDQSLQWMWPLIEEGLKERFHRHQGIQERLPRLVDHVRQGEVTPSRAAQELLFLLDNAGADMKQT
jgi:LAO/AO transport system kinase